MSAPHGRIRLARPEDAAAIAAIYGPIVRDTAISFEAEPPDETQVRARIAKTLQRHPWLVLERSGGVAGYAYAGAHRERAAYQWSVDVSCYVHPAHHRTGAGRALYGALFRVLQAQGFHSAYAGIALPNEPSVALHRAVGFEPVGTYREVGFKLGQWRDVAWWWRRLQDAATVPAPPVPLPDLLRGGVLDEA